MTSRDLSVFLFFLSLRLPDFPGQIHAPGCCQALIGIFCTSSVVQTGHQQPHTQVSRVLEPYPCDNWHVLQNQLSGHLGSPSCLPTPSLFITKEKAKTFPRRHLQTSPHQDIACSGISCYEALTRAQALLWAFFCPSA